MWNKNIVFLTGILASICVQTVPCYGEGIDLQFPLGTIGCLFSKSDNLCGVGSQCIDDLLFGTCSGSGIPDDFVYSLTKHDLEKLQEEILSLVGDGFTWKDGYTQCLLQNVIISLTIKEPFSKKICYGLIFENLEPVSERNDYAVLFDNLFKNTVNFNDLTRPKQLESQNLIASSQKRDEIVRVHKYFDKSTGQQKRQVWPSSPYTASYLPYYPSGKTPSYEPSFIDSDDSNTVTLEDLEMAERYLRALQAEHRSRSQPRSKLSELLLLNNEPAEEILPSADSLYEPELVQQEFDQTDGQPGYIWTEGERVFSPDQSQAEQFDEMPEELETPVEEEEPGDNALPPYLANKLDMLLRDDLEPTELSDKELALITPYVRNMLQQLGELNQQDGEGEEDEEQLVEDPQALEEAAMETGMMQVLGGVPFGVEEEDMNMYDGNRPETIMDDGNQPETGSVDVDGNVILTPMEEENLKEAEVMSSDTSDTDQQVMEKKAMPGDIHKAVKKEDVVDVNYAFIKMDKPLTGDLGDRLLDVIKEVVPANPGTLNNVRTIGSELKIIVDPLLAGVNASTVASKADAKSEELEKATGLKFLEAGIGNENEVGIKATNDRDFLVTFILCGCIASILLAVVVIYLIRRNTRSKEKLKQIASVQEGGNDAASKDYQDLCRQRMQSKSSEKPEPLHAASRVGSVSESQVRSPSSRSSTSSWSEEPVNSNMDISTGHIVLSYMEDHLKNKDRLDREWEAMCAYEADPCSTKVAEDQANNRKNRYTDVLPYDHSRVVLTTNTNVSGSDFINANTITDHDPRNPAYVATQGPLPHTVADFWQMVWEQGSVVIVMLTKLTENGESKCHRYWPEEGSDLYHIYEVHLVSEHIWCEDYLVRSFYLKNLQTSETRTVTQFHFLTWPDLGIPSSIKALLDFRRKVNKSYRGRSCPIVVHCSDGCGRTGTYSLIDMVLNRMAKGAKEIDIAATLEHIRDQRMSMVKTKEQFQFALAAVAEEVHAILKALPQ